MFLPLFSKPDWKDDPPERLANCFLIIKYIFSRRIIFLIDPAVPADNGPVGGVVFFPGLSRFLFMVKKHLPSSKLGSPICYFHSPISPLHTGTYHPTLHPLTDVIIEHYLYYNITHSILRFI